jgi:hypothetical protein
MQRLLVKAAAAANKVHNALASMDERVLLVLVWDFIIPSSRRWSFTDETPARHL